MNARFRIGLLLFSSILLAAYLAASVAADEEDAKPQADEAQARKALCGVWKGFAVEGKGENPDRGPVEIELQVTETTMHGYQLQKQSRKDEGEGHYKLDLAAAPRGLDGTRSNGRGRNDTWLGIYQLEGDTLKWCVSHRKRPTTFETVKGQFLLILKRKKPAE